MGFAGEYGSERRRVGEKGPDLRRSQEDAGLSQQHREHRKMEAQE